MQVSKLRQILIETGILLAFIVTSFGIYLLTLRYGFLSVWDDNQYVTENFRVQKMTWENIQFFFTNVFFGNYAPFHLLSYMLDHALWGLSGPAFHAENVLLHGINGYLLYLVLFRAYNSRPAAVVAAGIFLAHPVQVETVAWISERKSLLAMFFFLIAFLLHQGSDGTFRIRSPRSWATLAATLSALLSKSVAVVIPGVLFLYDLAFRPGTSKRRLLAGKLPYFAAAIAFGLLTIYSQSPERSGGRAALYGGTIVSHILTVLPIFLGYLKLLFWPVRLSAVYDLPDRFAIDGEIIASTVLLLLFLALLVYLYRKARDLFCWLAIYLLCLIPVAQFVPLNTLINDRYLYFPLIGIAGFCAGAISRITPLRRRSYILAGTVPLLAFLAFLSLDRTRAWENSLTLWNDARLKDSTSAKIWTGLAVAYDRAGYRKAAVAAYRKGLQYDPENVIAMSNLALAMATEGKFEEAREYVFRAIRTNPKYPHSFLILGHCYYLEGKFDMAESAFTQALALKPDLGRAFLMLGVIYAGKGDLAKGRQFYQKARETGGETEELLYHWGALDAAEGKREEALQKLDRAFALGYVNFSYVQRDPFLEQLRSDPEFRAILMKYTGRRNLENKPAPQSPEH